MAVIVQVPGLATVQIGTGTASALEDLGLTRNGVEIVEETFWLNVPGDFYGGDDGPPIDIQFLGTIARVRMELTKWDSDVADKARPRLLTQKANPGQIMTPGRLVFANTDHYRLAINCVLAGMDRDYERAIPRMPIEENRGTKFATLIMEWECHGTQAVPNVLYDTTV